MFRDENEKLSRNGQNEIQNPSSTREEVLQTLREMQFSWKVDSKSKQRMREPTEPRVFEPLFKHSSEEEQGICYVFRNYVYDEEGDSVFCSSAGVDEHDIGIFGYLPGMFKGSRENFNVCLEDAVIALGLAGISNSNGDLRMMKTAVGKYAKAVRGISASLPKAVEATKDEVLIAVLLLGLYEVSWLVPVQSQFLAFNLMKPVLI